MNLQIRVGLNSGEVVVGAIGSDLHMDYTAVGRTTHLASRMEQFASPGAILVTRSTLDLAEGFIAVNPLGPVPIRGLAEAVEVYEVTGPGPARTRLQAAARRIGQSIIVLRARTERDFDAAFATLVERRAGALVVSDDAVFANRRDILVGLAARHAIPAIYGRREYVAAGGLIRLRGTGTLDSEPRYRLEGEVAPAVDLAALLGGGTTSALAGTFLMDGRGTRPETMSGSARISADGSYGSHRLARTRLSLGLVGGTARLTGRG